jgi:peptidoglycan hydrolase-like protein with peptidoglycan-binding domain
VPPRRHLLSRGFRVTAAQHLLAAGGHAVSADGVFGAKTNAAVVTFQHRSGLAADGIVGAKTWHALVA